MFTQLALYMAFFLVGLIVVAVVTAPAASDVVIIT